jgi:hypothetical protein
MNEVRSGVHHLNKSNLYFKNIDNNYVWTPTTRPHTHRAEWSSRVQVYDKEESQDNEKTE